MIQKLLFVFAASCSLGFGQTAQSGCIDGKIFTAVSAALNFEAATVECQVLDQGQGPVFSLAEVRTIAQFEEVLPLISAALGPDDFKAFWIGLKDLDSSGGTDPSRFSYVSGDPGPSEITNLATSAFPWGTNQPDDGQGNVDQDCISIFKSNQDEGEPLRLDDAECGNALNYICSADCPTPPSDPPTTVAPTISPSIAPTFKPTVSPSPKPTKLETLIPTSNPTNSLTNNPSISPTSNPSASPTKAPNVRPTTSPIKGSTASPTQRPTPSPSTSPTPKPTTGAPTEVSSTVNPTSSESDMAEEAFPLAMMAGIGVSSLLVCSLLVLAMTRRMRSKMPNESSSNKGGFPEESKLKKELFNDVKSEPVEANAFSLDQFVKPHAASNLRNRKKADESSSKSSSAPKPPMSSSTLERNIKEKEDEAEFEALLMNNGKTVKSKDEEEFEALMANNGKRQELSADEKEFEAILSGSKKKKGANVPPPMVDARPQSAYIKSLDQNRRSIFRPSSLFLSKAKRDKAMKKTQEKQKKKQFDIDNDI